MEWNKERFTDKQKVKMLNYYRGYSFDLMRNTLIISMLLHTDIEPLYLPLLTDKDIKTYINTFTKRQKPLRAFKLALRGFCF